MRLEGKRGTPRPINFSGTHYPTQVAFARAFHLDPRQVSERVKRGITDARLVVAYPRRGKPAGQRSPMWVQTWFGWYKV